MKQQFNFRLSEDTVRMIDWVKDHAWNTWNRTQVVERAIVYYYRLMLKDFGNEKEFDF